nr:hypothetical protein [Deltaproteobacteria bacterium]
MNTMTRFAVVAVLAAMNLGGCVGAPEGELDSLTQEATASTTTPATDEGTTLAGTAAPSPLSSCLLAATHDFTGSSVDLFLDLLDTTADVSTPFTVAFNTAAGTCFFNAAEAGYGVRVNGRFRITTPIVLHHNVTASVVASPTAGDAYIYRVRIDVGDVRFDSIGDVDISTNCLALDRRLNGTMRDLVIDIDLAPPTPTRGTFLLRRVTPSFGDVTVVNPDALIPSFGPVVLLANSQLATAANRTMMRDLIASTIESQSAIIGLASFADLGFQNETGWRTSKTMCSDVFSSSCGGGGACGRVRFY